MTSWNPPWILGMILVSSHFLAPHFLPSLAMDENPKPMQLHQIFRGAFLHIHKSQSNTCTTVPTGCFSPCRHGSHDCTEDGSLALLQIYWRSLFGPTELQPPLEVAFHLSNPNSTPLGMRWINYGRP